MLEVKAHNSICILAFLPLYFVRKLLPVGERDAADTRMCAYARMHVY